MEITKNESTIDWAKLHLNRIAEQSFEENADECRIKEVIPGVAKLSKMMSKDVFVKIFMKHFEKPIPNMVNETVFTSKAIKAACELCIETGKGCDMVNKEPYYCIACDTLKNFRKRLMQE